MVFGKPERVVKGAAKSSSRSEVLYAQASQPYIILNILAFLVADFGTQHAFGFEKLPPNNMESDLESLEINLHQFGGCLFLNERAHPEHCIFVSRVPKETLGLISQ
jgi:hypothetical protein